MNAHEYLNFSEENMIEEIDENDDEDEIQESIVINPSQALEPINNVIEFLQQQSSNMIEEISNADKIKCKILNEKQKSQV